MALEFPSNLPSVPDELNDEDKALFIEIVDAMADNRVRMLPIDSIAVNRLVIQISIARHARKEADESGASAERKAILADIVSEGFVAACEVAKDLMIPDEALARLWWE